MMCVCVHLSVYIIYLKQRWPVNVIIGHAWIEEGTRQSAPVIRSTAASDAHSNHTNIKVHMQICHSLMRPFIQVISEYIEPLWETAKREETNAQQTFMTRMCSLILDLLVIATVPFYCIFGPARMQWRQPQIHARIDTNRKISSK